jgi:murein DD-endopeptidase MepM/ murein hydrolase activator NlpD
VTIAPDPRLLLGRALPLSVAGTRPSLDRRAVSKRWLSGTFLTAAAACGLMSAAFLLALDGSQRLLTPLEVMEQSDLAPRVSNGGPTKESRLYDPVVSAGTPERRLLEVPTIIEDGDRRVIKNVELAHVRIPLGLSYASDKNYPAFDPLAVFADSGDVNTEAPGQFYGANIESDVALRTKPFGENGAVFDQATELNDEEVEALVREQSPHLMAGEVQIAALSYVDPTRFGTGDAEVDAIAAINVKITTENVSSAKASDDAGGQFKEILIDISSAKPLGQALLEVGIQGESAKNSGEALATLLQGDKLKEGQKLRISAFVKDDVTDIRRISLYNGVTHVASIALDDNKQYVPADEPETVAMTLDDEIEPVRTRVSSGNLPSVYDAIYRASYAYGLSDVMAKKLIQLLAADLDLRSPVNSRDKIELLFSNPDGTKGSTDESVILMASTNFAGEARKYYRFESGDGSVDFYDSDGKSAKQFLLRNPVPNGVFRSGFGMRMHPILGYLRMHAGTDWAAPRGTPIIASGNGIVEKAGWSGAYGNQTIIKHANGYESSYSHQTSIARGVVPGAKVRQGQVIGTVGSTGLSTGPHLHYELIVNGTKVDSMRVRLPGGKALAGSELRKFEAARDDIDRLLANENKAVAAL